MKRSLRMAAVALSAAGVAFGTIAASPAMAASSGQAKSSCQINNISKKENGQTYIVGSVSWCADGDTVRVNDQAYDGRALGVRVSDGVGKYRYCKDSSGADDKSKFCNFNLTENRTITVKAYQTKKGHATIWLDTRKFDN